MVNYTPKILLSLKNLEDKETINSMTKQIKEKTLLNFDIEHVDAGYFSRESKNKVKFVEYVD